MTAISKIKGAFLCLRACLRVFGFAPRRATPMISEAEKRFREAERQLDELLRRDEAIIAARGITISDWSARKYHYKNKSLSWSYWFETRRTRGSEIEKVLVWISFNEYESSTVRVMRSAEIFQIGKPSRWSGGTEELLSLEEMAHRGLANIVLERIQAGESEAAGVI